MKKYIQAIDKCVLSGKVERGVISNLLHEPVIDVHVDGTYDIEDGEGWRSCRVTDHDKEAKTYTVEFDDGKAREAVEKESLFYSMPHDDEREEEGSNFEDDLSLISKITTMNRTMFLSDETPRFADYVGHMHVAPSLKNEMTRREEFASTLTKKHKR